MAHRHLRFGGGFAGHVLCKINKCVRHLRRHARGLLDAGKINARLLAQFGGDGAIDMREAAVVQERTFPRHGEFAFGLFGLDGLRGGDRLGAGQLCLNGLQSVDDQFCDGFTTKMFFDMRPRPLAGEACFPGVREYLAHQLPQMLLKRFGPKMTLVMCLCRFEVGSLSQFVIEQVRRVVGHELRVAAPVGGNYRQSHHHCLVLRPAPALATAWRDQAIGGLVQPGQLTHRELLGQQLNAWKVLAAQLECPGIFLNLMP